MTKEEFEEYLKSLDPNPVYHSEHSFTDEILRIEDPSHLYDNRYIQYEFSRTYWYSKNERDYYNDDVLQDKIVRRRF